MTSILKVDNIQNSSGTSAMTIDSSGRILTPARPAFQVGFTTLAWVQPSANTEIAFDDVMFDTNSNYSTSTGRFTAPVDGVYYFGGKLYLMEGSGQSYFYVAKNGTTDDRRYYIQSENTAADNTATISEMFDLTAGDYVSILWAAGQYYTRHSTFNGYLIG